MTLGSLDISNVLEKDDYFKTKMIRVIKIVYTHFIYFGDIYTIYIL